MNKAWHKHFCWKPIKMHGKWVWLRTVYRRQYRQWDTLTLNIGVVPKLITEYGTIMDVLKDGD